MYDGLKLGREFPYVTSMSQSLQQEVMQACQAQAEKLEVTSKTVGELQTSVTNMARVTEQISERIGVAAQGTQANVAAGLESLAHVERVFAGLRDSVVRLGAIADAIVEVRATSAMVEKLARQTNLLAVNAAIESERAGQSGAAFGVVAEEVRRLAESSRTTSEKISTAVADAAQAVQEIAVTTRAQVDESSAAIVATSADLGKVTASLRDLDYLHAIVATLKAERRRLSALLATIPYLLPVPSEANFVLCHVEGRDAQHVKRALEQQGILVRHYKKPGLDNCIRISVGRPEQTDRLVEALRSL